MPFTAWDFATALCVGMLTRVPLGQRFNANTGVRIGQRETRLNLCQISPSLLILFQPDDLQCRRQLGHRSTWRYLSSRNSVGYFHYCTMLPSKYTFSCIKMNFLLIRVAVRDSESTHLQHILPGIESSGIWVDQVGRDVYDTPHSNHILWYTPEIYYCIILPTPHAGSSWSGPGKLSTRDQVMAKQALSYAE